jgi:hypothetical protein
LSSVCAGISLSWSAMGYFESGGRPRASIYRRTIIWDSLRILL